MGDKLRTRWLVCTMNPIKEVGVDQTSCKFAAHDANCLWKMIVVSILHLLKQKNLTCPIRFAQTIQHFHRVKYERAGPRDEGKEKSSRRRNRESTRNAKLRKYNTPCQGVRYDALRAPTRWIYCR